MNTDGRGPDRGTALYRLEVDGPVPASWADWFEADAIVSVGAHTALEVRVTDQSELYGRLRRIHDLNLRLVSVTLMEGPTTTRCIEEKSK